MPSFFEDLIPARSRPGGAFADLVPEQPAGSLPGRIARDVGRGLLEAPRAVVKGARDAFSNLFHAGVELADWAEEKSRDTPLKFMNAGIRFTENGVEWMSPEEEKTTPIFQVDRLIPDLDAPKSTTGGLVKGAAQFVTGMIGASRVIGGSGYLARTAQGAASSFTAFDPHEERLANLVERFPKLSNPVTRYLAAAPDDNAAEGRLKSALEGAGLGLLSEGFVKSVKLLREAKRARRVADVPRLSSAASADVERPGAGSKGTADAGSAVAAAPGAANADPRCKTGSVRRW